MISTALKLRWNDIDMLGHLYNGQYQHLFDEGKSDFFESVLGIDPSWIATNKGLLTAQTLNNYYSPTTIKEPLAVQTKVEAIGTKSFTLFQTMINSATGEVKSDSRSVLVCYDPNANASVEIFAEWRGALEQNLEQV